MPKDIDIGQKLLGMEQLLRRTLGEHIECEFKLDPGLWLASVDPGNWRPRCSIWCSTRATPCHQAAS